MKTVCYSLLGTQLDYAGKSENRWHKWRPNISLCMQDDLLINELVLIYQEQDRALVKQVCEDIRTVSPDTHVTFQKIPFADPWDFEEVYAKLHQFLSTQQFSETNDYFINVTTGTHVVQICWFLLTESRHFPGRLIQVSPGKNDERTKGSYQLIDLNLEKYDQIAARFKADALEGEDFLKDGIQTQNAQFNAMIRQLETVAIRSTAPILLTGPTGAGKSQLAKRIYALKKQRGHVQGQFINVNCATLRGDQAMSALFGHAKGAFTGAQQSRDGFLKAADGGILFLDEIGELGLDEQAMLLHAIEEKSFYPVGSDTIRQSRFLLIAGTNKDLSQAAEQRQFRDDLLARINIWTYHLPSLSERIEDIEPNIRYECKKYTEHHGTPVRFNAEAWEKYDEFARSPNTPWVHNFRDLNASIYRMATLAGHQRIRLDIVQQEIKRLQESWRHQGHQTQHKQTDLSDFIEDSLLEEMDLFDQGQLRFVIERCQAHPTAASASRNLFQFSRLKKSSSNDTARLKNYLAKYNLSWQKIKRI
ncbi:RNA repair transcriptional activator RtcR [Algicola sagamiensis]|uniref:RNA repair transcriptional activator RtcR n=1 Tax=Algicola sagamiensis TaxID=163869 RepID=UPI000369FB16|nr:RNA repair transcriptional activator RtcR [Algicola sagamiensis]